MQVLWGITCKQEARCIIIGQVKKHCFSSPPASFLEAASRFLLVIGNVTMKCIYLNFLRNLPKIRKSRKTILLSLVYFFYET